MHFFETTKKMVYIFSCFGHRGAIHLRAEIPFQAEISGLEFWPVFSGRNFWLDFFKPEFQARNPGQNFGPKFQARKFHAKISLEVWILQVFRSNLKMKSQKQ